LDTTASHPSVDKYEFLSFNTPADNTDSAQQGSAPYSGSTYNYYCKRIVSGITTSGYQSCQYKLNDPLSSVSIGSACPNPTTGKCNFITPDNTAGSGSTKCTISCPSIASSCSTDSANGPYFTKASCTNFEPACSTTLGGTYDDRYTEVRSCDPIATPVPAEIAP
jgi:hypothetical protein